MQKTSLSLEGMKEDVLETSAICNMAEDVRPLGDSQRGRLSTKLPTGRYVRRHPLRPSEKLGVDCDRSQSKPDFLDGHPPDTLPQPAATHAVPATLTRQLSPATPSQKLF